MKRIIYHGSEFIIEKPEYLKGNVHNDYGLGFYCCSNKSLTKEWAAKRSGHGYVNKYVIRDDRLKILDLTKPPFNNVLYWVSLLMHNRELSNSLRNNYPRELKYLENKYLLDVNNYDVVIGYRADDAYFKFPISFIENRLSYEDLERIYHLGHLGIQYAFMSEKAIKSLRFVRAIECEEDFIGKYFDIVKEGTSQFQKTLDLPVDPNKTYLINMVQNKK